MSYKKTAVIRQDFKYSESRGLSPLWFFKNGKNSEKEGYYSRIISDNSSVLFNLAVKINFIKHFFTNHYISQ